MTTPDPLDDIMLPFGLKFTVGSAGSFMPAYTEDTLPYGIHTIQVTWAEPEGIVIRRSPRRDWTTTTDIGHIPAGEGRRSIVIPGVVVDEYTVLSIGREGTPPEGATVAVTVITVPLA